MKRGHPAVAEAALPFRGSLLQGERGKDLGQRSDGGGHFQADEGASHASVSPFTKTQVRIRVTVDAENIGFRKNVWVAVGGGEHQEHTGSGGDFDTLNRQALARTAAGRAERAEIQSYWETYRRRCSKSLK